MHKLEQVSFLRTRDSVQQVCAMQSALYCMHVYLHVEQELASFDEYSASLSAWCDQQKLGVSELPLVGAYLAVWSNTTLREDRGWFRAYVTKLVYKPRFAQNNSIVINITQFLYLQ